LYLSPDYYQKKKKNLYNIKSFNESYSSNL